MPPRRTRPVVFAVLLALAGATAADGAAADAGRRFVRRSGSNLELRGAPFRVSGSNNYYLMYKSTFMVDDVLGAAVAAGFNTLRVWGSLDIGNQDDSNSIRGKADGVYFHYWNGVAPAFNDGADGLQRLDYVVYRAGQLGLRLVIPFVNNWNDFGGMDQYVRWRGGQFHDDFYTDPLIRTWYKEWIAHVLNRVNVYTGIAYKDDPAIMMWDLANEPRCMAFGVYPTSSACTTQTLIDWAADVSQFIKSIDRNHLVATGDEGFFCRPGAPSWTEDCSQGVDTVELAKLPAIDVLSFHLYPDNWAQTDPAFGARWIEQHLDEARQIRKPAILGEFGFLDHSVRNRVYKEWTDVILRKGGAGALYWILSGVQDNGANYPDYDGFTVRCPSPGCTLLSNFAESLHGSCGGFAPVADDDTAVAEPGTPVVFAVDRNDVGYDSALRVRSIDLDPAAPGQQTELATGDGTFAVADGGAVSFTPAAGFAGKAHATYTIRDRAGRVSNAAGLTVRVKPGPSTPVRLFSFETGAEDWSWASWQVDAGAAAQSGDFATDGSHSLSITTVGGGWFGVTPEPAESFSPKTRLKWDVTTTNAGTPQNVALQVNDSFTWCQGPSWGWVEPGTTATTEIDLTALDCGITDLGRVRAIWLFFGPGGTFYVDNVRVE